MHYLYSLVFLLSFTSITIAQKNYICRYDLDSKTDKIELKDKNDKSIIILKKGVLIFDGNEYLLHKQKKETILINKSNGNKIGQINDSFRFFSFLGNNYKLSKKKRKPYNFVIVDTSTGYINSKVGYKEVKGITTIRIEENKNINTLPFIFLIALTEVNNTKSLNQLINHILLSTF